MSTQQILAIHWPSFGTYHLARLKAAIEFFKSYNISVIGLATASSIEGRPWQVQTDARELEIQVACPSQCYQDINAREKKRAIYTLLDRIEPNIVAISGYGLTDSLGALAWCKSHRKLAILMSETKADDAPRHPLKELFKRYLVSRYDGALCGGTPHRRYLQQLGMSPKCILDKYDVVDNQQFARMAELHRSDPSLSQGLPGLETEHPYFLASSRAIDRKNLGRLLQAYKLYRERHPNGWRLIILGIGPQDTNLKQTVCKSGIPDVIFPGFRQFQELTAYYARAAAFIHPALQEQWGLVVNEAMACGLPILISASVGCADDLVKEGENGFKFDPKNVAKIATLMEKIASDEIDRALMGHRSREIISEWTPQHFAENLGRAILQGQQRKEKFS